MNRAAASTTAAFGLFVALIWRFRFVCDDAFISFRYARNLARGLGLRYNVGVEPPVEGYSEFAWVLWLALLERLNLDIVVWSTISSGMCGLLLFGYIVYFLRRRIDASPRVVAATAWFVAALPPLAVWSTGGLATLPFSLAMFASFERLLGDPERPRPVQAGLLALAAGLLRADGTLLVGLVFAAAAVTSLAPARASLRRAVAVATAILMAGILIHVAWRYGYYGDYLPNTARVKVALSPQTFGRGLRYLNVNLLTFPAIGAIVLAAPALVARNARLLTGQVLIVIAGVFVYAVVVGGDFMCMGRFLVPALPFVALLLALLLMGIGEATPRRAHLGLLGAGLCVGLSLAPAFDLHPVPESLRRSLHFRWNVGEFLSEYQRWEFTVENTARFRRLGRALSLVARPHESIILRAIGATGYYSELFVYDRNGLVTREVAEREKAARLRSPGHDRLVPREFFANEQPTYWRAHVFGRQRASRLANKTVELLDMTYRWEVVDLPEDGIFRPSSSLAVLRRVNP